MGSGSSMAKKDTKKAVVKVTASSSKKKKNNPTQPVKEETVQPPPPQAQQQPQAPEPPRKALSDEQIRKLFNRYMEIQKDIAEREAKNLPKALQAKKKQAQSVKGELAKAEEQFKKACEKVAKEKADVDKMQNPPKKASLKDRQEFDEKKSKKQEEYLEAKSEKEVIAKQLDGIQSQNKAVNKEVEDMTKEMNSLMSLYDEQDQILGDKFATDDIFSGEYGSDLEDKLEAEVDQLFQRKELIGLCEYKWTNGRLFLQYAVNQLSFAVRRWKRVPTVPNNKAPFKNQLATETRNNLIAACENITSAKRYLNNIKFPYCEPEEIATLDKACSNIYVDMLSHDRHQHAMQCYSVTHRRACALLKWFDNVINTIEEDLAKAKAELAAQESALRKERLRLIKEKIGDDSSDIKISDKDMDFDEGMLEPELVAISEPHKVEGDNGGLSPGDDASAPAPKPLPLSELAPPPSQEDLFGNIEELNKQHQQDMAQLEKTQETNKVSRRRKRKRMEEEQ